MPNESHPRRGTPKSRKPFSESTPRRGEGEVTKLEAPMSSFSKSFSVSFVEASFMMMNQAILMMPKAQVIDSRLQDQASRIKSKIKDSRFKRRNQEATSQDFI